MGSNLTQDKYDRQSMAAREAIEAIMTQLVVYTESTSIEVSSNACNEPELSVK